MYYNHTLQIQAIYAWWNDWVKGSVALLWPKAKCKCKFANKCAQAKTQHSKWLSPGFTLHFTFCQSKATDPNTSKVTI